MIIPQPRWRESPRIQDLLEAVNNKRLAADYNVEQHELLELFNAVTGDHLIGDAIDILEVLGSLDESADIKVWGDGLERRPGPARGHADGRHYTLTRCRVRGRRFERIAHLHRSSVGRASRRGETFNVTAQQAGTKLVGAAFAEARSRGVERRWTRSRNHELVFGRTNHPELKLDQPPPILPLLI